MVWCNASVVDWEAFGAIGTWAVGGAAIYLAFQANRLGTALRHSQEEKDERSGRAMAQGLRLEVMHYGLRLKRLSQTLTKRAVPAANPAVHAAPTFEAMASLRLSDFANRVAALSHLPSKLADSITFFYAQEQTSRTVFENCAKYMRNIHQDAPDHEVLPKLITDAAAEANEISNSAFDLLSQLTTYLGLPPDPEYKNEK